MSDNTFENEPSGIITERQGDVLGHALVENIVGGMITVGVIVEVSFVEPTVDPSGAERMSMLLVLVSNEV